MSATTTIEWTEATWNPVTGCTEVSPGCDHCYAKTFAERWRGTPGHPYEHGFDVQLRPDRLKLPLKWRKPKLVFVNSMSDLFHRDVPDEYIAQVFAVMASTKHTYQLLTKRHGRMRSLLSSPDFRKTVQRRIPFVGDDVYIHRFWKEWPLPNVWVGVSTETQHWADIRIPALLDTPAAVRWISAEPLLGPIDLHICTTPFDPAGIDWVVAGGESGHGARPMHPAWARAIRDYCTWKNIPFLFKQWGAWQPQPVTRYSELLTFSGRERGCVVEPDGKVSAAWSMSGGDLRYDEVTRDGAPMLWRGKGKAGRELDDRTWDQYPEVAS